MEAGSKRKRDLECPRITYQAAGRTFDRLFREDSLGQLKEVARKKLGLGSDAVIRLSQIRGDTDIDLEDEEDFDAFYNAVHSSSTARIRVTVEEGATTNNANNTEVGQASGRKKRKLDNSIQQSSEQTTKDVVETTSTSLPGPTSRKRAVSFAQSGVSKPSEGTQATGPSAKRLKTTSSSSSEQPVGSLTAPTPQRDTSDNTTAASETAPIAGTSTPKSSLTTPASASDSPAPTRKTGSDGKKSTGHELETGADGTPIPPPGSGIARDKAIKEGEKEKAKKKAKKKGADKSKDKEDGKERPSTIENARELAGSEASKASKDAANKLVAVAAQPLPVKESLPQVSSEENARQKDTKSKGKKTKSSTPKDVPQADTPTVEKPKKTARSKSKVRDSTTSAVDSETNKAVTPDAQSTSSLNAISRLMIEKYLTPSLSTIADDAQPAEESDSAQLASAVQVACSTTATTAAPLKPTCPYCGKSLTHDRSRCPLIRAKLPDTIEKRIAELREDSSEDPENVRAGAIKVLEAAVQRKRGAEAKKEKDSKVSSSDNVSSTKPKFSAKHVSPAPIKSPVSTSSPARHSPSSSPSDSSDEDVPLKSTGTSNFLVPPKLITPSETNASYLLDSQKSLLSTSPPHSRPTPSRKGDNETDSSSEDETPPAQPKNTSKPTVKPMPHESEDSTSNVSDDETSESQPKNTPKPTVKPAPPESEGSTSNVSSDDEATPPQSESRPEPQLSLLPSADALNYSDKDLEALIRGPGGPLKSAELPSSESSEDEEPGDIRLDNESEQDEPRGRMSTARRFYAPSNDSSDESLDGDQEDEDLDVLHTPSAHVSMPPPVTRSGEVAKEMEIRPVPEPPQENKSFQRMGGRLSSEETDKAGNEAFEEVLAQENAMFGLAEMEPASPLPAQETPSSSVVTRHASDKLMAHDQRVDVGIDKEQEPVEEDSNDMDLGNAHVPERAMEEDLGSAENLGPDPIEAPETPEVNTADVLAPLSSTETPRPPEQPREELPRASTPKPGIMQRMRNRAGLASSVKKQPSSSNLAVRAVAKPPSTRAAALRGQQKPRTRSQIDASGLGEDEDDVDGGVATPVVTGGKPASRRAVAMSTKKPPPTWSKVTIDRNLEKAEGDKEEVDPPPRRSARTASKTAAAVPFVSLANPAAPSRKTRQAKSTPIDEEIDEPSQPQTRKASKQKKGGAKVTAKSPTPPPTTEDGDASAPAAQPVEPEVTLPPSPPMSLDAWATLQTETPVATTQSDPMIDELQSDVDPIPFPLKPQYQRKTPTFGRKQSSSQLEQALQDTNDKEEGREKAKGSPLFMPSESQTEFPHSQFQTQAPTHTATDSSDSEEEVRDAVIRKPAPSQPQRYRRLTDIASQAPKLFTPKVLRRSTGFPQVAASVPAKRKDRLDQLYGKMARKNGDDESDSGQGSDSEAEKISHIPKSRKAGAALKGRMSLA